MSAKPLTRAERAAALALLAAATPRPWRQSPKASDAVIANHGSRGQYDPGVRDYYGGDVIGESILERDRVVIIQAPELLERYEATVQQLERALAELGIAS